MSDGERLAVVFRICALAFCCFIWGAVDFCVYGWKSIIVGVVGIVIGGAIGWTISRRNGQ